MSLRAGLSRLIEDRIALGIVLGGLALTAMWLGYMRHDLRARSVAEFRHSAGMLVREHNERVRALREEALHLAALVTTESDLTREEFANLARHVLSHHEDIRAIEWAPRVPDTEREPFEQALDQGLPGSRIVELSASGNRVPAAARAEYFPVRFIANMQGNVEALGLDLAHEPHRRTALEWARDHGEAAVSAPLRLIQTRGRGVLLMAPVYDLPVREVHDRRAWLRGVVVFVIDMPRFVATLLKSADEPDLGLTLRDAELGEALGASPLPAGVTGDIQSSLEHRVKTRVAQRVWEIGITTGPGRHRTETWLLWLVGAGGIAITLLLALYRIATERRNQKIRAMADEMREKLARIEADARERARIDHSLRTIQQESDRALGGDHLQQLAAGLARGLGMRFAMVVEMHPEHPGWARTLALWAHGAPHEDIEYDLAGTPCAEVMRGEGCLYESGVQTRFPEDALLRRMGIESYAGVPLFSETGEALGLVVVMDDRPLDQPLLVRSVLAMFAARAGAEIERMHSESRLARSEQHNRAILDAIPDMVFLLDGNRRFVDCHGGAKADYLLPPEVFLGKHVEEILPADVCDSLNLAIRRACSGHGVQSFDYRITFADGREGFYEARVADAGRGNIVVLAHDIGERRRVAAELAREREQLRAVLDASPDLIFFKDVRGIYLGANRAMLGVLGVSSEAEVIGKTDSDLFDGVWAGHAHAIDREVLRLGEVRGHAGRMQHADGRWIDLDTARAPLRDADGSIVGLVGVARDVTRLLEVRREAEEALLRFRGLFEYTPHIAIQGFGRDGTVYHWNRASEALYGFSAREAIGKPLQSLLHTPETAREFEATLEQIWTTRQGTDPGVWPAYTRDRHEVKVLSTMFPVFERGEPVEVFCVDVDVTERERIEQELRDKERQLVQAQKMEAIGQLVDGVAHDFNNILASAMGYAGLAQDQVKQSPNARLERYLGEVMHATERARDLVASMLAFGRGSQSAAVALDARPLVKEVVRMLRPLLPASIEIHAQFADDLPMVEIDPVNLHQILMNLCLNARDAIHGTGSLRLELSRSHLDAAECASCHKPVAGEYVCLSVIDTGEGISAESMPRVFDPFFTTKEVGKGTGLGLSVVHGLVHERKGHILVRSGSTGTEIRILLPCAKSRPETNPGGGTIDSGWAHLRGARILVVDDEPLIGAMVAEVLERSGCEVARFERPERAVEWLRHDRHGARVLITDLTMPAMNGLQVASMAQAICPGIATILMTGNTEGIGQEQMAAAGISRVCIKPMAPDRMLAAVAEVLLARVNEQEGRQ